MVFLRKLLVFCAIGILCFSIYSCRETKQEDQDDMEHMDENEMHHDEMNHDNMDH